MIDALPRKDVQRFVLVSSIGVTKYNELPWRWVNLDYTSIHSNSTGHMLCSYCIVDYKECFLMLLPCLQCHELVWSFEVQKDGRGLLTRFWHPLHHYQVKHMVLTRTSAKLSLN